MRSSSKFAECTILKLRLQPARPPVKSPRQQHQHLLLLLPLLLQQQLLLLLLPLLFLLLLLLLLPLMVEVQSQPDLSV